MDVHDVLVALTIPQLKKVLDAHNVRVSSRARKAELVSEVERFVQRRVALKDALGVLSKAEAIKLRKKLAKTKKFSVSSSGPNKYNAVDDVVRAVSFKRRTTVTASGEPSTASRTKVEQKKKKEKKKKKKSSSKRAWRTLPGLSHEIVRGPAGLEETYGQVWKDVQWQRWRNWEKGLNPPQCDGLYEFGIGDPTTRTIIPVYVGKSKRLTRRGVVQRVHEYKNCSSSVSASIGEYIEDNYDLMFVRIRYIDYPAGYEERLLMTFGFGDSGMYICNKQY